MYTNEDRKDDELLSEMVDDLNEKIAFDVVKGQPKIRYFQKDGPWIDTLWMESGPFHLMTLTAARQFFANEWWPTQEGREQLFPAWMKHPDRRCFAFGATKIEKTIDVMKEQIR